MIESYRVGRSKSVVGYRFEMRYDGVTYQAVSDARMGSVVAAQRELVRLVCADHGQDVGETTERGTSDLIFFHDLSIERSLTQPGWAVEVTSGRYRLRAYLDPTLESFLAVWGAVMRFFAMKYGVVEIFEEVTRNRDRAREQGLA